MPVWIPIKEQLPPVDPDSGESEWVFTIDARHSVTNPALPRVGKYSNGLYAYKGWWSTRLGEKLYGISHWMPIPPITENE